MTKEDLKVRLEAGIALALETAPYSRDVVSACSFHIADNLPMESFACDKYWRIYAHPNALAKLSPPEIAWIILHESMGHLVRDHCSQAERHSAEDHKLINVAQDLEIESWEWPSGPATRPNGKIKGLHPSDFNLPTGEVWQWYYERIKNNQKAKQNCGSGAHGKAQDWELGPRDAPVKPGSAKAKAIRKKTARAVAAAKEAGNVPAGLEVWANQELEPAPVDWRSALRWVISQKTAAGIIDTIGPAKERRGLLSPRWRAPRPSIAIIADTSGSMQNEGGKVLGSVVDICSRFGVVDVCWIDVEPVWQKARTSNDLRPVGGGGTDLTPAILEARQKNSDAIVIITDCATPWPDPCNRSIVLSTSGQPPKGWRNISCPLEQ